MRTTNPRERFSGVESAASAGPMRGCEPKVGGRQPADSSQDRFDSNDSHAIFKWRFSSSDCLRRRALESSSLPFGFQLQSADVSLSTDGFVKLR